MFTIDFVGVNKSLRSDMNSHLSSQVFLILIIRSFDFDDNKSHVNGRIRNTHILIYSF